MDKIIEDELKEWLKNHEDDIAWAINDFGGLNRVYRYLFKRYPVRDFPESINC